MNTPQTITADRLSKLLSDATGQPAEVCDLFIREFFKGIELEVATGGSATIKGLGTFIATGNASAPIEFKPDESLRATVNAPFEAFPEIELEDSELDDSTVTYPAESASENLPENESMTESDADAETVAVNETPIPATLISDAGNNPGPTDLAPEADNKTSATDLIPEADNKTIPPDKPSGISDKPLESANLISTVIEPTDNNEHAISFCEKRRLARRRPSRCRMIVWMIIMLIAGFVAGMTAGYFFYYKINAFFNAPMGSTDINTTAERSEVTEPTPQHTTVPAVKDTTVVHADTTAIADEHTHVANEPDEKAKTAPEPKPARYDVVTNKIFLATLARKYYGQGDYWVYIYQANNLKHPDRIAPGTRLRIPYPEELPLSGNDSNDIKTARRLGQTIYARYR